MCISSFGRTTHKICLLVYGLHIYVNILYLKLCMKVGGNVVIQIYVHGTQRKMLVSSLP